MGDFSSLLHAICSETHRAQAFTCALLIFCDDLFLWGFVINLVVALYCITALLVMNPFRLHRLVACFIPAIVLMDSAENKVVAFVCFSITAYFFVKSQIIFAFDHICFDHICL